MVEMTSPKKNGARSRTSTPPPAKSPRKSLKGMSGKENGATPNGKKREKREEEVEFGGPIGCFCIMVGSHVLMFAMAASLYGSDYRIYLPTVKSTLWFLAYHASQIILARTMPGIWVKGQAGLGYWCNAYSSFYATLAGSFAFHYFGVFDMADLVKEYPAFLTTGIVLGNIYSVIIHMCYAKGWELVSIYEFFIGIGVHPRIGEIVDVKMVAETRVSWTLLLLITLGSFIECTRRLGTWQNPVAFMVLAHGLYANACAKGEHFIPYTWDITTEKFGWMLCWWNLAGVPLLYCYQSLFLVEYAWAGLWLPPLKGVYYAVLAIALVIAYCIWDEANYHKCYFKMERRGEIIERNLYPTFRHVKKPKYLKCDVGVLLIDGWYGYARKIHYTADTSMALLWGLSCGFSSPLPYVYFAFFVAMITHRAGRDEVRCAKKYGATWDKYLKAVPYRFIPGIW